MPRLRGLGGGCTQILLNGEPAPPGFSMDMLAPTDIERIEVMKGPTAEFGGVAGTINTRRGWTGHSANTTRCSGS
jgi:iron complex outermembrane receptor protein